MLKQRQSMKHQKSKKSQLTPDTADGFLFAGVGHEEAGEKWRSGDSAKSCRFFVRALDDYEAGIKEFPQSFDLAYNKARLQFEISQQPRLLQHLPTSLVDLLQAALDSHRYALTLRPDDTDALYNIAQVLTCIGDAFLEDSATIPSHYSAVSLLQEAVDTFQKCLTLQETRFEEFRAPPTQSGEDADELEPATEIDSDERWASVIEPITKSTLLETCLAEADALTNLLPLLEPDSTTFKTLEAHSTTLLDKAFVYATDAEQQLSYSHHRFNLHAALADFACRSSVLSPTTYAETLTSTWGSSSLLATHGPALCDHADALITFNATVSTTGDASVAPLRWSALTAALSSLATANTKPGDTDRSAVNALRGDVELLRAAMSCYPTSYEQAIKNRDTLLKNAEIYYEGARKLATADGDNKKQQDLAAKVLIVQGVRAGGLEHALSGLAVGERTKIESVVSDMREDDLLVGLA